MDKEYCIVVTTVSTREEADAVASSLLQEKLAACIQIIDITSYYRWDEEIHNEPEKLLFIKAKEGLYSDIQNHIAAMHSYKVPEIIKLSIEDGLPSYLAWIGESSR